MGKSKIYYPSDYHPFRNYSSGGGEYDIFWVLGDSLSRGASDGGLVGPTPTSGTVYEYHNNSLVEITNSDLADALDGSPWPQFGIDYNARSGRKVLFCNSAIGGSTITDKDASGKIWIETGEGSLWQGALDELDGITEVEGGGSFKGVIISGGVNDYRQAVKPTAAEFKSDYQDLIDRVKSRVGSSVPIYLFQVAAVGTAEATLFYEMRKVILELVSENSNVHLAFNPLGFAAQAYHAADNIHFIQDGNNVAGKQIDRYIANNAYSKTIRAALSLFDTELTEAEESLWITFLESCISNGNINALDTLQVYVASAERNTQNDIMQLTMRGVDAATFTQYAHLATDGSSTYVRTGHRPTTGRYSLQEDVIVGAKTGTFSTSAGTTAYLFGAFTTSGIMIFQNTSGLNYRVNDATAGFWNGETQFASNTTYAIGRNGGTRFLMKNKTQVHSAAVASSAPTGRDIAIGCRANGSSSFDNFSQTEVEYFFSARWTTLDYDALIDDLETLVAGLKALA